MEERELLTLESAVTAIQEAATAVAREVERDRLRETSLTRLSTVEAELNRSQLALERSSRRRRHKAVSTPASQASQHAQALRPSLVSISASQLVQAPADMLTSEGLKMPEAC